MGLLDDIRSGAIECGGDLPRALRKSLLLAANLGYDPFQEWVYSELNGYRPDTPLPDYRVVPASIRYQAYIDGWQFTRTAPPNFFTSDVFESATRVRLRQGVAELAAMNEGGKEISFQPSGVVYHYLENL
jgi:hypothetical protein